MGSERRAVVIGVNDYKDRENIVPLRGAVNDVEEVYERLTTYGHFHVEPEHYLRNSDATCRNIRKALSDLLWQTDAYSLGLIYFAGHGFQDGYGNGYIAPHDITYAEPFVCGLRMKELRDMLLTAQNKDSIILILDCCYSGVATDVRGGAAPPVADVPMDDWFATGEAGVNAEHIGRMILASSGKDEQSREKRGCVHTVGDPNPHDHGAFTYHFLEGLDGQAGDAGGRVTLRGIHDYVSHQMHKDKFSKVSFLGTGLGRADDICIAEASELTHINQQLAEADGHLSTEDLLTTLDAVDVVFRILTKSPRLKSAIDFKVRIDERLRRYRQGANHWVINNRRDIAAELRSEFRRLERLMADLCFDTFVKQDKITQNLLTELCQLGEGSLDPQTFSSHLNASRQEPPVVEPSRRLLQAR